MLMCQARYCILSGGTEPSCWCASFVENYEPMPYYVVSRFVALDGSLYMHIVHGLTTLQL
jgi:hypothetical protein